MLHSLNFATYDNSDGMNSHKMLVPNKLVEVNRGQLRPWEKNSDRKSWKLSMKHGRI